MSASKIVPLDHTCRWIEIIILRSLFFWSWGRSIKQVEWMAFLERSVFYFVCPWSEFSLTTSAEDIHTVSVWVKWCDLSLSWMGIRDFLLLGQYFFFSAFARACSSNGSTGLRAGCPSQLNQQIQHSPQHTECARMGPWGSDWFALCVFDTVRTPVIGPFSVGALQTGSCSSVLAARVLMQSPLHYFWEPNDRVTAASIAC